MNKRNKVYRTILIHDAPLVSPDPDFHKMVRKVSSFFSLVFLIALLLINHTMIPIAIAAMWLGTLVGYYGVTRAIVSSEELDAD